MGATQLDPKFDNIQSATKTISEDIRTTRHTSLINAPFEFHCGRKPNTEWSLFRDKLIISVSSDKDKTERSMLKPEDMRGLADSRTRPKVSRKERNDEQRRMKQRVSLHWKHLQSRKMTGNSEILEP